MADDWVEAGFTTIFAVAPRLDSIHPDADFATPPILDMRPVAKLKSQGLRGQHSRLWH
ncbi:MAG: hypothetical protein RH949_11785 [Coleofasciculus sp. A1-SPW-01]|uniref:hypothetical protein n=1 Tax=Coleofasciculus sp. A1-SPW-01 TaxID=3070819 RepID=UPI0032F2FD5E